MRWSGNIGNISIKTLIIQILSSYIVLKLPNILQRLNGIR